MLPRSINVINYRKQCCNNRADRILFDQFAIAIDTAPVICVLRLHPLKIICQFSQLIFFGGGGCASLIGLAHLP